MRRVARRVVLGVVVMVSSLAASAALADGLRPKESGVVAVADPGNVARLARSSVVAVEASSCGKSIRGTGFMVDSGGVLTNQHLIDGASLVVIADQLTGTPMAAAVEREDVVEDLAIVRPIGVVGSALELADSDAPIGTEVVMVGAAGGGYRWLSGRVHLYVDGAGYGLGGPVMLLEPSTGSGFSGGPVLDGSGRVVGVLRAVDEATGLTLGMPVSTVSRWLEKEVNGGGTTSCIGE